MESQIKKLASLFRKMVTNANTFGDMWKNISLGREAFSLMKELPASLPGEFDTPQALSLIHISEPTRH